MQLIEGPTSISRSARRGIRVGHQMLERAEETRVDQQAIKSEQGGSAARELRDRGKEPRICTKLPRDGRRVVALGAGIRDDAVEP